LFKDFILFISAYVILTIGFILIVPYKVIKDGKGSEFFFGLALSLDYVGGNLLYGYDGKTVSAITGKLSHEEGKAKKFERLINWLFDDNKHCYNAYIKELT